VPLFPTTFIDDLKAQVDIVSIIGEATPLRKTGGTYKGLCPFHTEKTPSFNVNGDKGFFKCFGCNVGGDVIRFTELHHKVSFTEAVRMLAQKVGMPVPDTEGGPEGRAAAAEREAIIKLHERALEFFMAELASPAGGRARRELVTRNLSEATQKTFRYGYAPAGGRSTLHGLFTEEKVAPELQLRSGLVVKREDGRFADRFRDRLMIPIARDTGAVVAFGGRALEEGQIPKYLNSSETPVYTKGRTVYGLDVTKPAIRAQNYCVLVEGYFDLAQVWQAGVQNVAALSGTAFTLPQVHILKRFTTKAILSLDPDEAGKSASARTGDLLIQEGFQVNVAVLPSGADPDTFIRRTGAAAYRERLTGSQPYLDFVMDRAAGGVELSRPEGRKKFLDEMLRRAAAIPDAAVRDQFADRVAHKARITESVIRDEIKKAAATRRVEAPAVAVKNDVRLRPDEQGLLWTLVHHPVEGLGAIAHLDEADFDGLVIAPIVRQAISLAEMPPDLLPTLLAERLSEGERAWLDRAAAAPAAAAPAVECALTIRRERIKRDIAGVQREIDGLHERNEGALGNDTLDGLYRRKTQLHKALEALNDGTT
jgi:DNA primase